ncbi:MAG: ABC transporter permease [Bryobacteraceae bacterium]
MPSLSNSLQEIARDLKGALRELRHKPAFSAIVILTLALGLGATTAVFSELFATVLKPLPYPNPEQLVAVHNNFPRIHLARMPTSVFDYLDLRERHDLFSDVGLHYFLDLSHTGTDRPQKVNAVAMTTSMFRTLGVKPLIGRVFTPDEERFQGPRAVILSEAYWRDVFGGTHDILRRTIQLDSEEYRIVGVMPRSFEFPNPVTQMWTPVTFRPTELASQNQPSYYLHMIARLKPGISFEQASGQIGELSRQMAQRHDGSRRDQPGWQFFLLPMARDDDGSVRRWIAILFAAVIGLLLVVCSNVAGLLLVRATERQFDFSLRMALGAGRFRIARQALTEVLVLAMAGGAAGLAISKAAVHALSLYGPPGRAAEFESPVFWFGAALTLATGMACGLYPAWNATRGRPLEALKRGGLQGTASAGKRRWQQSLIVAQVGLATMLLLSGSLLLRSFLRLLETPLGFNPRDVLTMQIDLPRLRYPTPESRVRFFEQVVERTRRIPGVQSVAGCSLLPFGYGENVTPFEIAGRPKPRVNWYANVNNVSPDYLKTMEIPLFLGRFFTPEDLASPQPIAVIDDALARRFFADEDPLGQSIRTPWVTARIVGVVGSVKTTAIDIEAPPTIYFGGDATTFVIRHQIPDGALASDFQSIVAEIDKDQPVYDIQPLETWVNHSLKTRRFVVFLVASFGVTGTLLSALGLYGVLSYWIAVRRRELGIRMALGATGVAIAKLVCSGGLRLVITGALLGCVGAVAAHRYIASQLYGVRFDDPITWLAAAIGALLIGVLACILPAWRAARTNVIESLRIG